MSNGKLDKVNRYSWSRPKNRYNGEYKVRLRIVDTIECKSNAHLVVNDMKTGGISRIRHHIEENEGDIFYIIPTEYIEEVRKELGYKKSKVIKSSTLKSPPKKKRDNKQKRTLKKFRNRSYVPYYGFRNTQYWSDEIIDDINSVERFYIPIRNGSVVTHDTNDSYNDISPHELRKMLDLWNKSGDKNATYDIIGIHKQSINKYKKLKNWTNILDYLTPVIHSYLKKNNIYKHYLTNIDIKNSSQEINLLRDFYAITEVKQLVDCFDKQKENIDKASYNFDIIHVCKLFNILPNSQAKSSFNSQKVTEVSESIYNKYPLLKYIKKGYNDGVEFQDAINSYINLF